MAREIPTAPTPIQKMLSREYAGSRRSTEHQDNSSASIVLKIHTNRNGLLGPNQLTREKDVIRIRTPIISKVRMFRRRNALGKDRMGMP